MKDIRPNATHPHADRFAKTIAFMASSVPAPARIIDIGGNNPMANELRAAGYDVTNTEGDLDDAPEAASQEADAATAFEIFEHLINPLSVLRAITAPTLFASVPMRLWFAPAYKSATDPWDRHYHEFEDWQFDWLLEKAGWTVVRREQWVPKGSGIPLGIRPLLRRVTPRWYVVEARRA